MKALLHCLFITLLTTTITAGAKPVGESTGPTFGDRTESRLITAMQKRQRQAEAELVRLWVANQRGQRLQSVLTEYAVREVRLRAITGMTHTGSLLDAVTKDGRQFKDPQDLASALALEHFRRQGIDVAAESFVCGTYLIKSDDDLAGEE